MWDKNPKIMELVNIHYNIELSSFSLYTELASRLKKIGYTYAAEFVTQLANDKANPHMTKIHNFLTNFDEEIVINEHSLPKKYETSNALDILNVVLKNELYLRKHTHYVTKTALSNYDFETFEFMQWFVKDAIKDINDVKDIIDILEHSNSNPNTAESMIRKWLKDHKE